MPTVTITDAQGTISTYRFDETDLARDEFVRLCDLSQRYTDEDGVERTVQLFRGTATAHAWETYVTDGA